MAVILFLIYYVILLKVDYYTNKKEVSPFLILTFPYAAIIVINNFVAVYWGFYKISISTIVFLSISFGLFYVGVFLYRLKSNELKNFSWLEIKPNFMKRAIFYEAKRRIGGGISFRSTICSFAKNMKFSKKKESISQKEDSKQKFDNYKVSFIFRYALICESIIFIRVLYVVINHGFAFLVADENEGYLMTGILGHLLLTLYAVIPILFYYWLKHKEKVHFLICSLLGISLFFLTFVKYHSICLIVLIYVFVALEDKKYLKKGLIIIGVTSILAFILSYAVTFISRGSASEVGGSFYLYHLWKYIGGSVINDNHIFTDGIRTDITFFFKLGTLFFALPNMFINKIFGTQFFVIESLPMMPVAEMGESSNVVDFIGYMYPSKGNVLELVLFGIFMIGFGFLSQYIYSRVKKHKRFFILSTSVYLTFFCFFSFFSTYGILSNTWEILIISRIIPQLFRKDIITKIESLIKRSK